MPYQFNNDVKQETVFMGNFSCLGEINQKWWDGPVGFYIRNHLKKC